MKEDFTLEATHSPDDRHCKYAGLQAIHCTITVYNPGLLKWIAFFVNNEALHLPQFGSAHIESPRQEKAVFQFTLVISTSGKIDGPLLRLLNLDQKFKQAFLQELDQAVASFHQQLKIFLYERVGRTSSTVKTDIKL